MKILVTVGIVCALGAFGIGCSKDKPGEPATATSSGGGSKPAVASTRPVEPAVERKAEAVTEPESAPDPMTAGEIRSEANMSLGMISLGMKHAFSEVGTATGLAKSLCGSAAAVPGALAMVKNGKKYMSTPAEWSAGEVDNTGFACVKFNKDGPQYWQYEIVTDAPGNAPGNKFVAYARRQVGNEITELSLTGTLGANLDLAVAPNVVEIKKPAT